MAPSAMSPQMPWGRAASFLLTPRMHFQRWQAKKGYPGHQIDEVCTLSTPVWMAEKPPCPLSDWKSFLLWAHCVICALVNSHSPLCEVFFEANSWLLKTACFTFGSGLLFSRAMQLCCLIPSLKFWFPFQFSNISLSCFKKDSLLKNLNL